MTPRLSLGMIVKNEEETLADVLGDAQGFCDELVVVDTGSSDETVDIAKQCGATVERFEWIDNFAAARNYAFDRCHGEWLIWLDADDRVPPEAQRAYAALRDELVARTDVDVVMIPYRYHYRDDDPTKCTYSFLRERVIRKAANLRWGGAVHEVIDVPWGRSLTREDVWVEHRRTHDKAVRVGDRNLRILEREVAAGDRSQRTLYYFANELKDNQRYEEALENYRAYLEISTATWEKYQAYLNMAQCAELLKRDTERVAILLEAIQFDSTRAEAFNLIGMHYFRREEWRRAIPFFEAATVLSRPTEGFVSDEHYTWLPWDYLSVCLANSGSHEAAVIATLKALAGNPDKARLIKNLHWTIDQL